MEDLVVLNYMDHNLEKQLPEPDRHWPDSSVREDGACPRGFPEPRTLNPATSLSSSKSFSLLEMIFTMAILSVIGIITIQYVVSTSQVYVLELAQREATAESAMAIDRMRREIRLLQTTLTADSNKFEFVNQNSATNRFLLSGSNLTFNNYPLAKDVLVFNLSYYNNTNGLLTNSSLPRLPLTNFAGISRIALDLTVVKHDISSAWDVNFFLILKQGAVNK